MSRVQVPSLTPRGEALVRQLTRASPFLQDPVGGHSPAGMPPGRTRPEGGFSDALRRKLRTESDRRSQAVGALRAPADDRAKAAKQRTRLRDAGPGPACPQHLCRVRDAAVAGS